MMPKSSEKANGKAQVGSSRVFFPFVLAADPAGHAIPKPRITADSKCSFYREN
jgi:hypothetical protein